uniref:NADH dehydrogenase subunit 6 n=1 Tax=Ditylenchus dipsaci TaxID=166011 RepID=A0A915CN92_9BILA
MIYLRVFSAFFVVIYALISISLFVFGLQESPIYFIFAFLSIILALLSILYYRGLSQERDGRMIPFVVAELILRLYFGFLLFGGWVSAILSIFNLSKIQSLIDQLSDTEFLFFAAVFGSLCTFSTCGSFFTFIGVIGMLRR